MSGFYNKAAINILLFVLLVLVSDSVSGSVLEVGKGKRYATINDALKQARDHDTVVIFSGLYKEGNIRITRPLSIIGRDWPVLDGLKKTEIITVRASNVNISGLVLKDCAQGSMTDPAAIRVAEASNVNIIGNRLQNNFFWHLSSIRQTLLNQG